MTNIRTVCYVRAGEEGEAGYLDYLEATYDVVVEETAVAALKRLERHRPDVDAVVVPATLPDLESGVFVERLDEVSPGTPLVVVGDLPEAPESTVAAIAEADAYVPPGRADQVTERVGRLGEERHLDAALDRYADLRATVADIAVDLAAATDREDVHSALYDRLSDVEGYRHVWVGDVDDGTVEVSRPVGGRIDGQELADLVGGGDPRFVERAVETGRVTTASGEVPHRSGAAAIDGGAVGRREPDRLATTAVPFVHRGQVYGAALVSIPEGDGLDGAERSLLGDVGAIVGFALWSLEAAADRSLESGSAEGLENLVHDLRNPLGIAQSHLEIARTEDAPESFDRVESAIERMIDIVDRAAIGLGGPSSVQTTTGDLSEAATRAWESIDAASADLRVEASPAIRADPDLLERLLSNLFQNAVDHGGDSVTIRIGAIEDGFYVEDDGPGIPETERESVFERGYSTTSEGHGIGLSIVRDVAEAHGWDVRATAGREGGARFEVTDVELVEEGATV